MTGRRAVVGLCMLCALAFSAFAAQSASASTLGTTLFTCQKTGSQFSDPHCKTASGSGSYSHVAVPAGETTVLFGTNTLEGEEKSTALLESKQAGIAEQIISKHVHVIGSLTNATTVSGEHYFHGWLIFIFTEVEVTKPAGKGCKVKGGKVETKELSATSQGQGMFVKIAPASGTVLAEFEIEGCSTAALNGKYSVTGSLKAVPSGATTSTTHAEVTTQGTLFVREQAAGLQSTITNSGRAKESEGPYTPLSVTTVETP